MQQRSPYSNSFPTLAVIQFFNIEKPIARRAIWKLSDMISQRIKVFPDWPQDFTWEDFIEARDHAVQVSGVIHLYGVLNESLLHSANWMHIDAEERRLKEEQRLKDEAATR